MGSLVFFWLLVKLHQPVEILSYYSSCNESTGLAVAILID